MVGGASTEETRAYLQDRLCLLAKVLFYGLGGVVLFSGYFIYELYPHIRPALATHIFMGSVAGVGALGLTWRSFRVDGRAPVTRSSSMLITVDLGARGA